MALRNIVKSGDEVLRKTSREVTIFDERLHTLLDDMADTMKNAAGVGLAAPQVGVLKRIFVIDRNGEIIEFINPNITKVAGTQIAEEGCLSCPGKWGTVKRPAKVTVTYQDRNGATHELTVDGLAARAVCHENDHLNGVLFVDKVIEWVEQ